MRWEPTLRALKGGIPRAYRSHKTPEGRAYGGYVRSMLEHLGELPDHARPTLKAAGVAAVDLDSLTSDLEQARAKGRRRDQARIRRQLTILRTQMIALERRLEELAQTRPVDFGKLLNSEGERKVHPQE
jgi:hypothetical protein